MSDEADDDGDGKDYGNAEDPGAALYNICAGGDAASIRAMLELVPREALSWHKPGSGWTPLHVAVEMGELDAVQVLVRAGASLDLQDAHGWTALCLAVDVEIDGAHQDNEPLRLDKTDLLLRSGADPSLVGQDGKSAMSIAQGYRCTEAEQLIARYLRERQ